MTFWNEVSYMAKTLIFHIIVRRILTRHKMLITFGT